MFVAARAGSHPGLSSGAITTDARGPRRDLYPYHDPHGRNVRPGSVRNGTRRVEGAKVGSCGMSASGRIDSFAKLSGNDGYLRLLFVHCGLTLGRRFGRTPIALSPANRTSARATSTLRDPVVDRGSCLFN